MTPNLNVPVPNNWYETFFTSPINAFWEAIVSPEFTQAEVAFIERHLRIGAAARVLDVPCGAGRHSLALARRGYRMTSVDISLDAVTRLRATATTEGLSLTILNQDMATMTLDGSLDGAICFGNSFGYLPHAATLVFLRQLHAQLRSGARFIIDTGMIAEAILATSKLEETYEMSGYVFDVRNEYDVHSSRMNVHTVLRRDSDRWEQSFSQAVYTCGELIRLLDENGFSFVGAFGDTNDSPFKHGDQRLLLVVQRR